MTEQLKHIVGLFGTAGESSWREPVMMRLDNEGIAYFNPVVEDWTPECAEKEATHMASDKVILFVVTSETDSFGSLAETGWAARSALEHGQDMILVIERFDGDKKSDAARARELVKAHAEKASVEVLDDMDTAVQRVVDLLG